MATRMQQRRGTAAQWTAANPVLAAGEIGFETDANKFKIGNGSSTWSALTYFANAAELAAIIDGAPDLLNTLNELAASIGDDPAFFTTINNTVSAVNTTLTEHANDTTGVHGIGNTALLALSADVTTEIGTAITTHNTDTTDVHGIENTALLATTANVEAAASNAAAVQAAHAALTLNVHGIADTALLSTTGDLTTHNSDTTGVHGIADTSLLATTSGVDAVAADAAAALSSHGSDTSNVHGIADTTTLVTQTQLTDAITGATVDQSTLAGTGIDWNAVDERFDIDSTVATKTYADNAVSTHNDDTTNVHGIADTALLALKSEVAAVTKSSLGLENADNTSDANKPVSTLQAAAIATAKAEAIADATSQVNAILASAPAALDTLDELAAALGDDANFASTVTTNLGLKVDSITPIIQKTASYTMSSLTERDDLIEMDSSSAVTLTIPTNASVAFPVGTSFDVLQTGSGQVTIAGASGVTVNATPGLKLRTQYSSATCFKRAENLWVVYGDLTA